MEGLADREEEARLMGVAEMPRLQEAVVLVLEGVLGQQELMEAMGELLIKTGLLGNRHPVVQTF